MITASTTVRSNIIRTLQQVTNYQLFTLTAEAFMPISIASRNLHFPVGIIAVSETWINTEKLIDFKLDGYEFKAMQMKKLGKGWRVPYI